MSPYYSRTQLQRNGLTTERIEALMFFLWGTHGREGATNKEAYDMDRRCLEDMMWAPVDLQFILNTEIPNL